MITEEQLRRWRKIRTNQLKAKKFLKKINVAFIRMETEFIMANRSSTQYIDSNLYIVTEYKISGKTVAKFKSIEPRNTRNSKMIWMDFSSQFEADIMSDYFDTIYGKDAWHMEEDSNQEIKEFTEKLNNSIVKEEK